jgi:hypothetical protein
MTDELCWHPDLLRRFVPTPYVFSKFDGSNRFIVESNDLEIALGVRQSEIVHREGKRGLVCKFIRDMSGPMDHSEITIVSDEVLRVLSMGRGTILIYDRERSELLGFIARKVPVQELVSSLIPALLEDKASQKSIQSLLQRSDKQHIG